MCNHCQFTSICFLCTRPSFCLCKQKSGSEHFKNLEQHYFFIRRKCFIWISYVCENTFKKENHNTTLIGSFDFKNHLAPLCFSQYYETACLIRNSKFFSEIGKYFWETLNRQINSIEWKRLWKLLGNNCTKTEKSILKPKFGLGIIEHFTHLIHRGIRWQFS